MTKVNLMRQIDFSEIGIAHELSLRAGSCLTSATKASDEGEDESAEMFLDLFVDYLLEAKQRSEDRF